MNCPSIDYRDRFSPLRDQNGNGLCWAFAGSALIEEELCLENKDHCGEQVSVIDGHRCYWDDEHGLATHSTGAMATGLYSLCAINQGVCSEHDAPFVTNRYDTQDRANAVVLRALQQTLQAKIQHNIVINNNCQIHGEIDKFLTDFRQIVEKLVKNMADEYIGLKIDYSRALLLASRYTDALKMIFISENCRQNRFFIQNKKLRPVIAIFDKMDHQQRLSLLTAALSSGRSASLGLCGRRARKDRYEDLFFMSKWSTSKQEYEQELAATECGAHSIVINGMRMKDGRCQIHVRNSWGAGSGLEGWEDAEHILKYSMTVEYLTDQQPKNNFVETEKILPYPSRFQ